MNSISKLDILGVKISAAGMDRVCQFIIQAIRTKTIAYICTCPVNTIIECRSNKEAAQSINSADIATADGMPVAWVGRIKGFKGTGKVSGSDLMSEVCRVSQEHGFRNYFYGSTPDVLKSLERALLEKLPKLEISGVYSPPFSGDFKDEDDAVIEMLNRSGADILWVGLGSPKQDIWVARHRASLNIPVIIAVGAAFDFISGTKRRAPVWMQNLGLEWSFRFFQEPARLWKRYLVSNFIFVFLIFKELALDLVKTIARKNPAAIQNG